MAERVYLWTCSSCGRRVSGPDERCSGSFLDRDHPSNAQPRRGAPDSMHTQACLDQRFVHHAATGEDLECSCGADFVG